MIYPTRRAVLLAAAGAPLALALGLAAPSFWYAGGLWALGVLGLMAADAGVALLGRGIELSVSAPTSIAVGGEGRVEISGAFPRAYPPRQAQIALEADERLGLSPDRATAAVAGGTVRAVLSLKPLRRGEGALRRLWVRWRGPLGLVWTQKASALSQATPITPDIAGVKAQAIRLFARDAMFGSKAQIETGEGAEFHALKDFVAGMDRRTVDWKRSARHGRLVAKEYRTERNHHIILALDTGRVMSEPLAGPPRIDRAINAALLLAYVSLRIGDRAGLFGFDARPNVSTGALAGTHSFGLLQRMAAQIDYTTEETNYTLGLTALAAGLERRSLVVIFTDFADATSAELLIENAGRLMRRHLVLFVVMRDEELEALARAEPCDPADVSRAITAAALLREREVVISRLRRMGAHVVDAPADQVGPDLLNAYLDLKRRDLL